MITQRIMSGLSFRQIADMCGTSVEQIKNTNYHLNEEIRLTNAGADYKRNADGTIEVLYINSAALRYISSFTVTYL